jgi:SAM-dependent methyltransferase
LTELPLWKRCLDVEHQAEAHYNDYVATPLFDLVDGAPSRVLELGCAGGAFGAELVRRYPGASVVGIEANRAAARRAESRLQRVICARLESLDFAQAGFSPGEFDTVVACDVLEHLVNPWQLLERIKPFLAPHAQVLASIPNVRNMAVVSPLVLEGRFDYAERGLLDITHLRFFTLRGIGRLFEDTGYVLEQHRAIIHPELESVYRSYQGRGPAVVKMGRMTLAQVSKEEITELCAAQFIARARVQAGPIENRS